MSSDPAIRLDRVGKAYRIYADPAERLKELLGARGRENEFWALSEVSLEVAHGETVGVIGANGAGKSTLLQIVTGSLKPTAGTVRVDGRIAPMIELGAGFDPEFTGRENAVLAADVLGLADAGLRARLDDIIAFADLGPFIDRPLKTYSSGMYARLAFAVFAHMDADVMILDEILSVGDASFNQKCMRRIREFKERGAILFTSHDMQTLVNLCDRVVWLERGMVRDIGNPQEVCRDYLAAMNAEANAAENFRIGGGRRKPPPLARPHTEEHAHLAPPADAWAFDGATPRAARPRARILGVSAAAPTGAVKESWQGGEDIRLTVSGEAFALLAEAAIVFDLNDRLGQVLISERAETALAPGRFEARFEFSLPELHPGECVLTAYLLTKGDRGVVIEHEFADALILGVFRTEAFGLVGVKTPIVQLESA
jgi:lipopolysaccharide transport system ATP-binding protein